MAALLERLRIALPPPRYLARPAAGIDISTSGVKIACLSERSHGLELAAYGELRLPTGAVAEGEIGERAALVAVLAEAAKHYRFTRAHVSLPESKSYLFETSVEGEGREAWQTALEPHLDEFIPLSPSEAAFDLVPIAKKGSVTLVAGIGYARRIVEEMVAALDEAGVEMSSLEGENFALTRALLPFGDTTTVLVVDIGKTTTKILIAQNSIPRFATTIGIGGHALTLAVQKHFGVTEEEAKKVKAERGIVPAPGNEDYLAAMLSTCSAIRDEIARRLNYWQGRADPAQGRNPVTRAILVGGNASVRGLSEYLEGALRVPVATGDVFTNFAPREAWLPSIEYMPSLAYGTAIGLALRDYAP